MERINDVVATIGNILSDRNFIASLMQDTDKYNSEKIENRLGRVFKYYIATRDSHIGYTYEEIERRYKQIENLVIEPDMEMYRNVVTHGFFTHSFNGYKKDIIMKYGLNYMNKMKQEGNEERIQQILSARSMLKELEDILGKSEYINDKHASSEVFITVPGDKTVSYACSNAPERLYKGPLKNFEKEPMVVGETKQTYMLRVLRKKIQQIYPDTSSTEYLKTLSVAEKVTEYFCSKSPSVAFLSMDQLQDMPVSTIVFKQDNARSLSDEIEHYIASQKKTDRFSIIGEKSAKVKFNDMFRSQLKPNIIGYRLKETGEEVEPIIIKKNMKELYGYGFDGEYVEIITGYTLKGTDVKVSEEDVEKITDGYYIKTVNEEKLVLQESEIEEIYREFRLYSMFSNGSLFVEGLGNLVTLAEYVPDEAIAGIVDMYDEFEMKQIFAKAKGRKNGDLIDYNTCMYIGESTIDVKIEETEAKKEQSQVFLESLIKKGIDDGNGLTEINQLAAKVKLPIEHSTKEDDGR